MVGGGVLYNPENDLNLIHEQIRSDDEVLDLMGLDEEDKVEIASQILKRSFYEDLSEGEKRLNIYFRPARRTTNQITTEHVLQIDCHVPAKHDYKAYRILSTIYGLIHKQKIGNRKYYFDGQLGELPTMPGFFCAGIRFYYFATI